MIIKGSQVSIIFCVWLYLLSGCSAKQNSFDNIDLKKVDQLIGVQRINSRSLLVNFGYDAITAIDTDQGIVVIDAGISTVITSRYRKRIENVLQKDHFIYVINTHGHHDHAGGNAVFTHARLVGHENCSVDLSERWTNLSASMASLSNIIRDYERQLAESTPNSDEWYDIYTQKTRYMSSYSDLNNNVPARLPDIIFSDSLTLTTGDTTFEMFYFGKSHSNSDIMIFIPELKLIFTGDLFSKFGRPGINATTIDEARSRQAILWIQKRMDKIEKVIGGHGQILSPDDLKQFYNNILRSFSAENIN
jgi:glyoxylase-like metal-dependent hydrolase (beta-lactamase superfamily II)